MEPTTPELQKQKPDGVGPVVGIVIIVIILCLGGVYYLMQIVPEVQTPVDVQAETR